MSTLVETQAPNQLKLFAYQPTRSEVMVESFKLAFAVSDKEEKKQAIAKKRYYIHRQLKNKYPIDPDKMTVDIPYASFYEIPDGDRYWINQLLKIGYNVQIVLL